MTNFRGIMEITKKLTTKQAKAAKLQAPKTSKRSHLLTARRVMVSHARKYNDDRVQWRNRMGKCAHVPLA
jgi:predicted hydrolase (HD superfamily)